MKNELLGVVLSPIAICLAALCIAGCAVSPDSDGGIVGSGNRIDCDALPKRGGSQNSGECQPQSATPR
jgi:hypothetical protein